MWNELYWANSAQFCCCIQRQVLEMLIRLDRVSKNSCPCSSFSFHQHFSLHFRFSLEEALPRQYLNHGCIKSVVCGAETRPCCQFLPMATCGCAKKKKYPQINIFPTHINEMSIKLLTGPEIPHEVVHYSFYYGLFYFLIRGGFSL